jgi:hypothetical protein
MEHLYAVEMNHTSNNKLPGFFAQIVKEMAQSVQIIDRDSQLFVIKTEQEAEKLKEIFSKKNVYEETHTLLKLSDQSTITSAFHDYGFKSASENYYLFADLVVPFQISSTDPQQIEMALLQIDEHLIAKDDEKQTIYYVDQQHETLIKKYAIAYDIELSLI